MSNGDDRGIVKPSKSPFGEYELLERDRELEAVEGLVGASGGGGRLLAIQGPPGIGKTTLVAEAKRQGLAAGFRVLSGRGSELERAFSYGVVRQLFEPSLAGESRDERAELLAGSAALAAPVFDPAHITGAPEADSSLAPVHGLYWLTANLSQRGPLLLAVDDLHWSDLASLRWLAYLLPRLEGLDVVVVVALRPAEEGDGRPLIDQILSDPVATGVSPAALTVEATGRLLRERLSADCDDSFCLACHEETGGNPLLLRELVHGIVAEGLAPTSANLSHLHEIAARAGSRTVSLRLARLRAESTRLAQAVAVLGDGADPRVAGALAGLDATVAAGAAADLARVEVLRPGAELGYVHPLLRAAVYDAIAPVERNAAHARAARLLSEAGADPERVAAHLLRSSPSGDAWVIVTLRRAARRASARGASESATAYLRRALAEPPPAADLPELLAELGSVEAHADGDAAIEHLRAAHELTEDPIGRAQIALLLGRELFLLGDEESDAVYTTALAELAGADGELEHQLEAGLIHTGLFVPGRHETASRRLEAVRGRIDGQTVAEKLLLSLLALHDAVSGSPAGSVVPLAWRALAEGTLIRADVSGAVFPLCTALAMADRDEVLLVFEDVFAEAHRRGSTFAFAAVKVFRAQTLLWRGDLGEAEEDSREALAAARTWGASARLAGHAAAFLADALMEQGRFEDAAAALAGATPPQESVRMLYLADSSARLRILRGDIAGGAAEMLDAGRRFESVGMRNPALVAWRSTAAAALVQLGERDDARHLAAAELDLARAWGAPRALGAALRVAGMVEGGKRGLALLGEAVEVLVDSPAKLEHAKARTELGAALRRAGHQVQAREQLRRAVELARLCGATRLAERAGTELLAAGARPRRTALSGVESLTPSEGRVAELAAQGQTNREVAQALFVTQRTVEVHLTSVFRKLGISSRSKLPAALAVGARP
jgi:DNA-binding CsgD family transcriptional regulator